MEKSPSASMSIPLVVFFIFLDLKLSGGIVWSWWCDQWGQLIFYPSGTP